jgi:hypothetical protein
MDLDAQYVIPAWRPDYSILGQVRSRHVLTADPLVGWPLGGMALMQQLCVKDNVVAYSRWVTDGRIVPAWTEGAPGDPVQTRISHLPPHSIGER